MAKKRKLYEVSSSTKGLSSFSDSSSGFESSGLFKIYSQKHLRKKLNINPGCNQYVFDIKPNPQNNLDHHA